ncbi:MAG: hypothetical protein ACRDMH_17595 [Solirubrobacterales bacterium]
MTSWIDPRRVPLAVVAAALATMGAIAAQADRSMAIWSVAVQVFAAEAIVGITFAAFPSGGSWSERRRTLAGATAALAGILAPALILLTMARAACGCGDPATGYMLPTLVGLTAPDWVGISAVAFPVLMALTTIRFRARQ